MIRPLIRAATGVAAVGLAALSLAGCGRPDQAPAPGAASNEVTFSILSAETEASALW